jgi:hypothetical protein
VYRIFNYNGGLRQRSGLRQPAGGRGPACRLQTALANQVNLLVSSAGLGLNSGTVVRLFPRPD